MRIFSLLMTVLFLTSCSTTKFPKNVSQDAQSSPKTLSKSALTSSTQTLSNVEPGTMQEYVEPKGVVFAKAVFQGILATNYAKLILQQLNNPSERFQVFVGSKVDQSSIVPRGQNIRSEYFFIELPQGDYKITSISIPVGTAMATEDSNIVFSVAADQILYLGTLKVTGTRERIKLGGIPVIQPGFEYEVEVLDQFKEGLAVFRQMYPNVASPVAVKLMRVSTASGKK
jgi:hypothetical protein